MGGKSALKSELLYDAYQTWAMKTYGDSAKTKTVTKKKYQRIVKILKGEESSSVENSKFRFWVKAKGFRLGPIDDHDSSTGGDDDDDSLDGQRHEILYVACSKAVSLSSSTYNSYCIVLFVTLSSVKQVTYVSFAYMCVCRYRFWRIRLRNIHTRPGIWR